MSRPSQAQDPPEQTPRIALSNEWHARPQIGLPAPLRCTHTVCLRDRGSVHDSRARFADFCSTHGQSGPGGDSRHHFVQVGNCLMKWEGHTEADSYTMLVAGNGEPPFAMTALDFLDHQAQEQLLGKLFVGVHVEVLASEECQGESCMKRLRNLLGNKDIYGGTIATGKAELWSSFRLDASGFQRLIIIDRGLTEGRLSRMLQRALDAEAYRILAMHALPRARRVMGQLNRLEPELDGLMNRLAEGGDGPAQESELRELTTLAARIEHIVASSAYRFAAARAYAGIVERRLNEMEEGKVGAAPRYGGFLLKTLLPAMRTCDAAEQRTRELAQRVTRATQLLDSMVDMERKKQNQAILEGMAERAKLQLRLQQSVEGFSIFAISYYAVGLVAYLLKSAKSVGAAINPDLLTGAIAPAILMGVWLSVRRIKKRLKR